LLRTLLTQATQLRANEIASGGRAVHFGIGECPPGRQQLGSIPAGTLGHSLVPQCSVGVHRIADRAHSMLGNLTDGGAFLVHFARFFAGETAECVWRAGLVVAIISADDMDSSNPKESDGAEPASILSSLPDPCAGTLPAGVSGPGGQHVRVMRVPGCTLHTGNAAPMSGWVLVQAVEASGCTGSDPV
jgi:hypothetical protein